MAIKYLSWALDDVRDIEPSTRLILSYLANCANEKGVCWPSIATLVAKTGHSEATVKRKLADLVRLGAMRREARTAASGRSQSNVYILNLSWLSPPPGDAALVEDGVHGEPHDGAHSEPHGAHGDPQEGLTVSPPLTLNRQIEPSGNEEEETRALEINFQKIVKIANPGPTESLQRGRLALAALSADEVEQAVKHAPGFFKAIDAERRKRPSIAIYLTERRWEAVARQAAMKPTERTGGKIFVRKGTDAWKAWAKVKGQDPDRMRPCTFSPSAGAEGWYFDTLFPPKQGGNSEDAA